MTHSKTAYLRVKDRIRQIGIKNNRGVTDRENFLKEMGGNFPIECFICIPYNPKLSKNYAKKFGQYRFTHGRQMYTAPEHHAAKEEIIWAIKSQRKKFYKAPLGLSILVQKSAFLGDAVNTLDGICDAVKVACDVDDKWFYVNMLQWEIKKDNPQLFILIVQDTQEDCLVCSRCGGIFPISIFTNKFKRFCKRCKLPSIRENGTFVPSPI